MKNVRKIAAAVLTVAFSLMGCTSKESISKSTKQEEAQKEIKIELTFLQNECDRLINKDEDIEKTFQRYTKSFFINILLEKVIDIIFCKGENVYD